LSLWNQKRGVLKYFSTEILSKTTELLSFFKYEREKSNANKTKNKMRVQRNFEMKIKLRIKIPTRRALKYDKK